MLFLGGAVFVNAIPHLVSGLMGRRMPTPFTRPPGRGHSSAVINVGWGFFNLLIAWILLVRLRGVAIHDSQDALIASLGGLLLGLALAYHFGRLERVATRHPR